MEVRQALEGSHKRETIKEFRPVKFEMTEIK